MIPPGLRAAYEAETRALCRRATETACWLAVTLVPLFGVIDWAVFPEQAPFFLELRLICVALVLLIYRLLHTPFGERHAIGLGVLVTSGCGLMVDLMTVFTGREASPYYAGINLVQCAIALLMPWSVLWSLSTSAVLVGGYVMLTVASGPVVDARMFVSNLSFLGATAAITVVSTAFRERLRAQAFVTRAELAAALRHKDDFLAKMSHELRTPIHVVVGYVDILLEDALSGGGPNASMESRRLVHRIRDQGVRLHHMISELLDYAKADAGKMDVRAEPVRVPELVERVADSFRPLIERKGLRLETALRGPLPDLVSDGQRLEQILTNLVGNAVKFTERGSVTIAVHAIRPDERHVLSGFTFLDDPPGGQPPPGGEPGPGLAILVRDTGVGIRDEDIARLAADFHQVEGASEKYGGTGLGLSISKKLAHLLGGRIAVRSRYAVGSTFALVLPVSAPRWRAAA
jgi:signal transduction histidine kinase